MRLQRISQIIRPFSAISQAVELCDENYKWRTGRHLFFSFSVTALLSPVHLTGRSEWILVQGLRCCSWEVIGLMKRQQHTWEAPVWKKGSTWEEIDKRKEDSQLMLWALVKGREEMPRMVIGALGRELLRVRAWRTSLTYGCQVTHF